LKICIFGAGAIGGFLAVSGGEVDLPAPTIDTVLALIRQRGCAAPPVVS
jgi:hypothetical protein